MIRRSSKILLEITVGLLAGLALLAGMAVWRLSAGPVPLDFLTPYLEEVFAKTRSGMTVEVRPISGGGLVGYDLVLQGVVGQYRGPVNGSVRIFTDMKGEEELVIPIAGIVRAL